MFVRLVRLKTEGQTIHVQRENLIKTEIKILGYSDLVQSGFEQPGIFINFYFPIFFF